MTTQNNISTARPRLLKTAATVFKQGIFAVATLCLFFISTAKAQDRAITLDEAIKLGLQNSNVLKLSQSRIDEAVSQYNQVKDRSKPTANASFGYNYAEIPANKLEFGSTHFSLPNSADVYLGIVSINQVIFGANRLKYAEESTSLLTQVSRLDAVKDKDQITYDIIEAYYNLYKVLQSKKVVLQNLDVIGQQIKQSQRFFDQGIVTKNDVLRFQLQRANIQLNNIDLETNRKIINYNLNILLGLPENTQLTINQVDEANKQLQPLASFIDTAMANRAEIKQLDLRTRVSETNISNIKSNTMPTLSASGSAYYVDVSANPVPQSGKYITPISVGVTLSWNFGSLWTNKNKVSQARIQLDEVAENKAITINSVKRQVNESYQNYMMALDKIQLLQASIAQAGENNKILESKYRSNIASATDRADAQTLLYQAEINLELAKADAGLAYYTLLKSTGKLNN